MKKLLLLLMTLHLITAVNRAANQGKLDESQYLDLGQSTLSKFVIGFATMSSKLERPLKDLDYAIQDMYEDLKEAVKEVEQDYFQRSAQHKKVVDDLDMQLGNAQIEIQSSRNLVDNILSVELTQLNKKIEQLKDFVNQNRYALGREEQLQKDNTELFKDKFTDHQKALQTLDIALAIVAKFISGELDLNQKEKVQREIMEMTGCLNKNYNNYPLVSALIESIPSVENMKQLKKIRYKLTRIRQSIQDQYNEDLFHDRSSTNLFEKRQQQLDKEYSMFQNQIIDNTHSITQIQGMFLIIIGKIQSEEEFQDMRMTDIQLYSQQKQDENASFSYEIAIYQDLKNQYLREFSLGEKAITLVKSNQFSDLVRNNIDLKIRKAQLS